MIRFGELTDEDRGFQAEAFVRMVERRGYRNWRDYFDWWAGPECKDFHPGDAGAIRLAVEEIMVAGGASTLPDPFDFFRIGHEDAA